MIAFILTLISILTSYSYLLANSNFSELSQITPDLAMYYSFHSSTSLPTYVDPHEPPPTAVTLGASAALNELLSMGCSMATKQWVDNHWGLILWKLAGMVCLDPASESDPEKKRWCWKEVMRQLRYRYASFSGYMRVSSRVSYLGIM